MIGFWIAFNVIIAAILVIDLKYIQRKPHEVSMKEVGLWLGFLVFLALSFCGGLYFFKGHEKAMQFLAGYIIELSLSVDNLFVFLMIFEYFSVPPKLQPRVLHWGILGAVIMRFILIFAGSAVIQKFHWIIYVFGVVLIYTGAKMAFRKDEDKPLEPYKNPIIKLFDRFIPTAHHRKHDEVFFVRENGVLHATPLFIVLLLIESSDLIFAVDSIPAVFAVTTDFTIVYTSNVFAILGLRALYFLLSAIMPLFRYLKTGISIVLGFVGVKMLISHLYPIPIVASLSVIIGVLGGSILLSIYANGRKKH